jgi:hypothetical protein
MRHHTEGTSILLLDALASVHDFTMPQSLEATKTIMENFGLSFTLYIKARAEMRCLVSSPMSLLY